MKYTPEELINFIRESNRIEGILRDPTDAEIAASETFLSKDAVTVSGLQAFVSACQPGASLRTQYGMDVRVGSHRPPLGGPKILSGLESLVLGVAAGIHPYSIHLDYEHLHPFTDGNGRSGRILWAWQMLDQERFPRLMLGFLHAFYYQVLERGDKAPAQYMRLT